ncbi:MAG: hypothetical protein EAZ92_16230 [Candidatus Kapaibacterium sp.]|nr:MAG: hypothetical protein EAZ92_16230 [Candidatus Kapabacteria bacterium]
MNTVTQNDIEALFHLPPHPRSTAIALTPEQMRRWEAIENEPYQVQDAFFQAIIEEQRPERERILRERFGE